MPEYVINIEKRFEKSTPRSSTDLPDDDAGRAASAKS